MMAAGQRVMTRLGRGSRGSDRVGDGGIAERAGRGVMGGWGRGSGGSDRVVDGVMGVRAGRAEDFLRQGELPVKIGPPASPAGASGAEERALLRLRNALLTWCETLICWARWKLSGRGFTARIGFGMRFPQGPQAR